MSENELKLNDQLAIDRTRLAAERSLMAWIRTALSMIAFGFTIYKFLQALHEQSTVPVLRPNAPRNVGLLLVGIGTFAVAVACIQHWKYVRKLSPDQRLVALGPGVHRGDPDWAAGHPDIREHGLHQRAVRLIGGGGTWATPHPNLRRRQDTRLQLNALFRQAGRRRR